MEYVDSTDELAYITSLEQDNAKLIYALEAALKKMLLGHHKASSDPDAAWHNMHQAENIVRKALGEARQ